MEINSSCRFPASGRRMFRRGFGNLTWENCNHWFINSLIQYIYIYIPDRCWQSCSIICRRMVSCTKPPSVNVLHRKLFRVLTPTANLITAILHRTPESFIWYVLVLFLWYFCYFIFYHFLHQFFCYQFSKEPVTETNETNDGNQWLKEASDGNQWNQWRKPVTETNETNDGNQWRKYIISMLPMITTGFGYGYSQSVIR